MASYPKDQFDKLPENLERIGAHRGPKARGRGWIGFAWALLATGLLVFGGLFGLSRFLGIDVGLPIFDVVASPTPTPTPVQTAKPVLDATTIDRARAIRVTVLNGTQTVGLEAGVAAALAAKGWVIDGATEASAKDVAETIVYYSDAANEDVARGVVLALGQGRIRLIGSDTFPGAPVTVVLGSDYQAPTAAP